MQRDSLLRLRPATLVSNLEYVSACDPVDGAEDLKERIRELDVTVEAFTSTFPLGSPHCCNEGSALSPSEGISADIDCLDCIMEDIAVARCINSADIGTAASELQLLPAELHCHVENNVHTSFVEGNTKDLDWQLLAGEAIQELLDSDDGAGNEAFLFLTNVEVRLLLTVSHTFGNFVIKRLVFPRRQRLSAILKYDG